MFSKVLIANRGAIACRIIRTLKKMGVISVAIYSNADADSLHVSQADESYSLGDGGATDTYLNQDKILAIAHQSGAEAIHPGYGFLSENPDFVAQCEAQNIVFLGPTAQQMNVFGLKHSARELAQQASVPLLPGTDLLNDAQQAVSEAERIGYPVMLKSTAGGGGIGMQRCNDSSALLNAFESVKRLSENNFSNNGIFLEKFIEQARHIEVQIFGDGQGQVIALGERDCSAQRRHQKVIEETPAPNLSNETRDKLQSTAIALTQTANYRNAGTVEYVLDQQTQQFYFLEVNTRLQVEHGVTEAIFDVDLVQWMVQLGAQELPPLAQLSEALSPRGHAIQMRLYAEDANKNFQPCAGLLSHVQWPEKINDFRAPNYLRIDHWIESGTEVSPFFDPMLAKVICYAADRQSALHNLQQALTNTELYGIEHNLDYVSQLLSTEMVQQGRVLTQSLNEFSYQPATIDVLSGGTQSIIQDYPGRVGYWDVGVPPSGPMDSMSFRLINGLLNNSDDAAGLEMIISGPSLMFNAPSQFVIGGSDMEATLDGKTVAMWQVTDVGAGQTLKLGRVTGAGARSYFAVKGGLQCPDYLGSKSTFTLGQFGGHSGRALLAGDVLRLPKSDVLKQSEVVAGHSIDKPPVLSEDWAIRVIYGPHGAPDFFTQKDISEFFDATWQVHFNSSRTGVRLIGPKPEWARTDGGEAGLHPSNIHDNAYAVGTIDFTGDMPVILGPDGPSLGGFVCPATIIKADLWKMGQLKAGDTIKFQAVSIEEAAEAEQAQSKALKALSFSEMALNDAPIVSPIVHQIAASKYGEKVVYRPSGEDYLLVEYGEQVLDIRLRFRVHALMLALQDLAVEGIYELTPGIRSLQIHYDNFKLPMADLLAILETSESALTDIDELKVPARIVHLPLSWDDEATRLAIQKYDEVVRKDAPWCPDNIEFIRRINGLDSVDEVKRIVFDASYLVMGLGDVYLGAPVATPMDPRHRLVTTKYNPARTWTPENAVGIGGAYLCVYGMEGPGGYQFVGRTLQMWNRYRTTQAFEKPWLLRFFDQIRFYEVEAPELLDVRQQHPRGQYEVKIEHTEFSLADYQAQIDVHQDEIAAFKTTQQKAFEAERQRWIDTGQADFKADALIEQEHNEDALDDQQFAVESHVAGNIWQVLVEPGDTVVAGQKLMILEAMKMELEVLAPEAGTVVTVQQLAGSQVHAGQRLIVLESKQ
ncbi:urea carboxylase [Echinimonas agarilytica]|uniref:Biotin carboxylase n=1 Tax=Echinimonas agarilytica TaxID=1215918 RepID=A0AA41W4L9_9GAMM|nr:urea carboxylase [Echinimonas agarilytica]MCM2678680.1 urea carboxylase [Echinimonas agarilytica]